MKSAETRLLEATIQWREAVALIAEASQLELIGDPDASRALPRLVARERLLMEQLATERTLATLEAMAREREALN